MILSVLDRKVLDQMFTDACAYRDHAALVQVNDDVSRAERVEALDRIDSYCELVQRLSAGPW
jgi:hypothetical protein